MAVLTSISMAAITYSPADGFFVCPESGMSCTVVGCIRENDCSIINNDFVVSPHESIEDGEIYVAQQAKADVSIAFATDSTEIVCDDACECQSIVAGVGCRVAEERGENRVSTGVVAEGGQDPIEAGGSLPIGLGAGLAAVLVSAIIGGVWYQRRKNEIVDTKDEDSTVV